MNGGHGVSVEIEIGSENESENEDNGEMEMESEGPMKGKGPQDWEVESACHTLMQAEKIKQNKPLMNKVQEMLGQKKAQITSLEELMKVADKKIKESNSKKMG